MTSSLKVLLLSWLHLCLCLFSLSPCCGQTCSIGTRRDTAGSCYRSKPCRADHQLDDIDCVPNRNDPFPYPTSRPPGITKCPIKYGVAQRCQDLVEVNDTVLLDSTIASASVELKSIDYLRFAMNVTWSQSYNPTGGYEVRVKNGNFVIDCYCVNDPDMRSLYLDDTMAYPPFTYRTGTGVFHIEVLPLSDTLPDDSIRADAATMWPRSCLDIEHTRATCGLPVYDAPSDVAAVYRRSSKSSGSEDTLYVGWQYKTAFVDPTVYYVEIYNINEYFTFVVNNASSIVIKHLPLSTQYYVHVQPYMHCSGLANRTYSLGCGQWSRPVAMPVKEFSFQLSPRHH